MPRVSSLAFKVLSPCYHSIKAWAFRYPAIYAPLSKLRHMFKYAYPESALAHRYLDNLHGVEIGASAFNAFGLQTININCTVDNPEVYDYKGYELSLVGKSVKVDLVALGDDLPFADGQWDFILTSHVVEHFYDPIRALQEWYRVVRPGGYVFLIVPHKERTFDKARLRTRLAELIERHAENVPNAPTEHHHCVWITEDFLELCAYLKLPVIDYQDRDDKAGNGFTVVIKKSETAAGPA